MNSFEHAWESTTSVPDDLKLSDFLTPLMALLEQTRTVSLLFCDAERIQTLNRVFRNVDRVTDVLSFPARSLPGIEHGPLGDIAIAVPIAQRQAQRIGHDLSTELRFLVLHGLLHLLGYDHETDQGQMLALQRSIQEQFPQFLGKL